MAHTQIIRGKSQIAIIEESTQDTLQVPTAASVIMANDDVSISVEGGPMDNNVIRGDFLRMARSPGAMSASISFSVPLKGSGTAGTAPEYDNALKACGMLVTNVGGTSDTYTATSTFDSAGGNPHTSYSIHLLNDGTRFSVIGAFGNVSMTAEVDSVPMLNFTFSGAYSPYTDDGLEDASAVYDVTVPQPFIGATMVMNFGGAHTLVGVTAISWDLGNVVALGKDASATYGYYGARITGRNITGSMTMEKRKQSDDSANIDVYDHAATALAGTIGTGVVGGTAGNKWAVSVLHATLGFPSEGDADGIMTWTVPFDVHADADEVEDTDIDLQIQFT